MVTEVNPILDDMKGKSWEELKVGQRADWSALGWTDKVWDEHPHRG